ncbi:MAG TPA: hypothetical protein VM010_04100 [Chitinophagaceae bacterium]|nr:hypothetical protein [Chitinophagaceae bacterium]
MKSAVQTDAFDLWEAWIDSEESTDGGSMLHVIGDVCTGTCKAVPILLKKQMQGAAPSHLILEVMPSGNGKRVRQAEIHYVEQIADLTQYEKISICAGESIIACIQNIEVVC